jgi:hemerythrin-like domain-containing protein
MCYKGHNPNPAETWLPWDFSFRTDDNIKKRREMAIQIGAKPDSGFDDPLGMLKDCHRRIEHFLNILCLVAERPGDRSLTEEERSAVKAALQYFHTGGERHTLDEEESLFPRLCLASGDTIPEVIASLEGDHAHAAELHESVDWLYTAWISAGILEPGDQQRLLSNTSSLMQLYKQHIEIEETIIFPRGAEILDSQTIAAIGYEFNTRRK